MTTPQFLDRSLGDLARSIPGATAVFHQHDLDFCCGGKKTLRDALAPLALDPEIVTLALTQLLDQPGAIERDWRDATAPELIAHLLERYHARHRQQLPELIRLSRRVETVHGDRPECPHGLASHLETMLQELESHMQKEEQILFPLLQKGVPPQGLPPVAMMRFEHDQHGEALARMVALAHGLVHPRGACNTWRALMAGLVTLKQDLMQHIHLENNVLFEGLNQAAEAPASACACTAHAQAA